jgi:hypothetical protein
MADFDPETVDQLWRMLDDLAANNPNEYSRLIEQAKEEQKRVSSTAVASFKPEFIECFCFEVQNESVVLFAGTSKTNSNQSIKIEVSLGSSTSIQAPFTDDFTVARTIDDIENCHIPFSLNRVSSTTSLIQYDAVVNSTVASKSKSSPVFEKFLRCLIADKITKNESQSSQKSYRVVLDSLVKTDGKKRDMKMHVPEPHANPELFQRRLSQRKKNPLPTASPSIVQEELPFIQNLNIPNSVQTNAVIEVLDSVDFEEVTYLGGRDWVNGIIQHSHELKISIMKDTCFSQDIDFELSDQGGKVLVLIYGGYEPVEIQLPQSILPIDIDKIRCKISKKSMELVLSFT